MVLHSFLHLLLEVIAELSVHETLFVQLRHSTQYTLQSNLSVAPLWASSLDTFSKSSIRRMDTCSCFLTVVSIYPVLAMWKRLKMDVKFEIYGIFRV